MDSYEALHGYACTGEIKISSPKFLHRKRPILSKCYVLQKAALATLSELGSQALSDSFNRTCYAMLMLT